MNDQTLSGDSVPAMVRDRDHLQEGLDAVIEVIDKHSGEDDVIKADSFVRELKQIARNVEETTKKLLEEGRLLQLGVVGQVKAGKSSLLNLLLFDGQEVLPKAATPMTASLTHIVKSDRDEIEIEYYTAEEWKEISDHALEYEQAKKAGDRDINQFMEAAAQLVEMADKKGLNIRDHLGKNVVHQVPSAQLNDKLRRFVGSNGDMTPLVKSVTIRSSQGMADLDIVDTPGINDPIASRSRQAMRMLGPCDAVLMLSYAGQLMGDQDVKFFKGRIPSEGIKHCLVIGSKFDSALVDVSRDHRGRLDEAKTDTELRLKSHADEAVAKYGLEDVLNTDDGNDGTVDVVLTSAMCAVLARRPCSSWAPDERHTFDNLQRVYPDWFDQPDPDQDINQKTRDNLVWIGNQEAVDNCLKDVRANKDGIMAGKMTNFLRERHTQALEKLADLTSDLQERRTEIKTSKISDVESQQRSIGALQEELETKVTWVWEGLIEKRGELIDELRDKVRMVTQEAREGISHAVRTEQRTRTRKKRVEKEGLLNAALRFVGFDRSETREFKEKYDKKVLDRAALENAIDQFCEEIEEEVQAVVEKMYDRPFRKDAIKTLVRAVQESFSNDLAAKVNMDALKRSLREAISRIVEEADRGLRSTRFDAMELSFQYDGSSAKRGRSEGREFVKEARDKAIKWLDSCKRKMSKIQDRAKSDLVQVTIDDLEKYQERLKKDIKQKRFVLDRYDRAIDELQKARDDLEKARPRLESGLESEGG